MSLFRSRMAVLLSALLIFSSGLQSVSALSLAEPWSLDDLGFADGNVIADQYNVEKRQSKLRVMIVGDSMTHGQQGDFTWRYRISQWFANNNVAVDFVGPYVGTVAPRPANPGPPAPPRLQSEGPAPNTPPSFSGKYAVGANFDSDHFSAWGRAVAQDKTEIYNTLTAPGNMADMILVMLGFNDMGWFYSDAYGTLDSMWTFVNETRRANPKMKFAIANVPQRSFIGGRQDLVDNTNTYNGLLANAVPKWNTAQSPVRLVHLQENYNCAPASCPAGYDGLHPNELGEYQIAQAFSRCLHDDFGMGSGALAVPANVPARALAGQPITNFKVFSSPQGVSATWDTIYGAYSYDVESTITTSDGGSITQNWSPSSVQSNRWDSHWPLEGWTYTVRVRARAGDTPGRQGPWTTAISAVAHPQLAPGPKNVKVAPTATGVTITFDPPTGPYTNSIVEYNVIYWDIDSCNFVTGAAFKSSPAHIDNLPKGHHIFLAIVTWNANGEGFPEGLPQAIPGYGTPATPGKPRIDPFNPTSVQLTWDEVPGAAGYAIWMRNINDPKSVSTRLNGTTNVACVNNYFLYPGVWNYEFCVSAYNGDNESPKGACAVAPSVTTSRAAEPTCPAGPQWCANGPGPGHSAPGAPSTPINGPGPSSPGVPSQTTPVVTVTRQTTTTTTSVRQSTSIVKVTKTTTSKVSLKPSSTTTVYVPNGTNLPESYFTEHGGIAAAKYNQPLYYFVADTCYPQEAVVDGVRDSGSPTTLCQDLDKRCKYKIPYMPDHPHLNKGPQVPTYYAVNYCPKDNSWRIIYELYFSHDVGHTYDWEWSAVVYRQVADNSWAPQYLLLEQDGDHPNIPWNKVGTFDNETDIAIPGVGQNRRHPRVYADKWHHSMWINPYSDFKFDCAVRPQDRFRNDAYYMFDFDDGNLQSIDVIDPKWDYGSATNPHISAAGICDNDV